MNGEKPSGDKNKHIAGPEDPPEDHTGVSYTMVQSTTTNPPIETTVEYTYEHVDKVPGPFAEMFRVTTVIEYSNRPIHKNVYYVDSGVINEFVTDHFNREFFEELVDVRPISRKKAKKEIDNYRNDVAENEGTNE